MDASSSEIRRLQLEELSVLDELDRICKKHGLRYYLTAGTLLGAVRHGGFIPWDDDVDVAMPRKDYDKLFKICQTDLHENFFYQNEKTERLHTFFFAKIRKNGTHVTEHLLNGVDIHDGCYVDIFPLDKCPDSPRLANLYFKTVRIFNCAIISKVSPDFKDEYTKRSAKLAYGLLKRLPFPLLRWLRHLTRKFFGLISSGKTLATVAGSHGYPRESYKASWFSESVDLTFECKKYPAPKEYDALLTNMYGSYMTPPPDDEQSGHFEEY